MNGIKNTPLRLHILFHYWKLAEDTPFDGKPFVPNIGRSFDHCVLGEYKLGWKHALYLLQHQDLIPKEWQGMYLMFQGTSWKCSHEPSIYPYLTYHDYSKCREGGAGWFKDAKDGWSFWYSEAKNLMDRRGNEDPRTVILHR